MAANEQIYETKQFCFAYAATLLTEARKAAESEGVALNHLITLALAEKVSAMRTEEYFEECAGINRRGGADERAVR